MRRKNYRLKIQPSDLYVRSFIYLFYTLIKLYCIKSSEQSSLITGTGSISSSPEAKNPGIFHSSSQKHFNTIEILPELRVFQQYRAIDYKMKIHMIPPNLCGFTGGSMWVRKIPWRRAWQPTPIFLPGEFYGQGSLVGYSPQACKELDTTEATEHRHIVLVSLHIYTCLFFYFLLLICEITHFDAEI